MSSRNLREKDAMSSSMHEKRSFPNNIETCLVRYPDVRIHYAIQDHMPRALHRLSMVLGIRTWLDIPQGTLEPDFSQRVD